MRKSYIRKAVEHVGATYATQEDISYLALETRSKEEYVSNYLAELKIKIN